MARPPAAVASVTWVGALAAAACAGDRDPRDLADAGWVSPSCLETRVSDVQGAAHGSPLLGRHVELCGVVTRVLSDGLFIEAPDALRDRDARTSEGVLVFTGAPPPFASGDLVLVSGTVTEASEEPLDLPTTGISADAVRRLRGAGTTELPVPVVLGESGRAVPREVDGSDRFVPTEDALDFFESLEGMRLSLPDARVVGPSTGGVFTVVADASGAGGAWAFSGALLEGQSDANAERIAVAAEGAHGVGDRIGELTGVLSYARGRFLLLANDAGFVEPSRGTAERTLLSGDATRLTLATYNAQNLSARVPARLVDAAALIVEHLRAPDIVALQEIQDDDGPAKGTLSADRTLSEIVAALRRNGAVDYAALAIEPTRENDDGGVPDGNIRTALLYRTDRVGFSATGGEGAARFTLGGGQRTLNPNPARVAPDDPAWANARKPLAAEFCFLGHRVVVVAVHLSSRSGDDPLFGARQPPESPSAARRARQGRVLSGFVGSGIDAGNRATVVLGDFNEAYGDGLEAIAGTGLIDLTSLLPAADRYTYNYGGNASVLDHVFVSPALAGRAEVDAVHLNADFASATRASDHDPVVVRLGFSGVGSDCSGPPEGPENSR